MDACESTLCRPNTVQVCCDVRGNINPIMVNIEVKEKHHIRRNNSMPTGWTWRNAKPHLSYSPLLAVYLERLTVAVAVLLPGPRALKGETYSWRLSLCSMPPNRFARRASRLACNCLVNIEKRSMHVFPDISMFASAAADLAAVQLGRLEVQIACLIEHKLPICNRDRLVVA